jgi:hypothetical protein
MLPTSANNKRSRARNRDAVDLKRHHYRNRAMSEICVDAKIRPHNSFPLHQAGRSITTWEIFMKAMGPARSCETMAFQERSSFFTIRTSESSQASDSASGLPGQHWRNLWQETSFERLTPRLRRRRTAKRYGQRVFYSSQARGRTIP